MSHDYDYKKKTWLFPITALTWRENIQLFSIPFSMIPC